MKIMWHVRKNGAERNEEVGHGKQDRASAVELGGRLAVYLVKEPVVTLCHSDDDTQQKCLKTGSIYLVRDFSPSQDSSVSG